MKKLVFASALLFSAATFSAFTSKNMTSEINAEFTKKPNGKICFKIKNDSGKNIVLFAPGSGTLSLSNNASRDVCVEEGKKLSIADKGREGRILLKVGAGHAGKKINLSSLM